MRQIVRNQVLSIPGKLRVEVRIVIDDKGSECYISNKDGTMSTSLALFPFISITLTRPSVPDENGNRVRPPWNPNDSLGMTKFTMPIFIKELVGIAKDIETPELYTYHGKRLELNEEMAAKFRRVFMISNTTLELSTVVIVQPDESRVEGIKMKFNNEQSSVVLTLNELTALLYNLKTMDVDSIALLMYTKFVKGDPAPRNTAPTPNVDIVPKAPNMDDFI